jgi:hypothetical protein
VSWVMSRRCLRRKGGLGDAAECFLVSLVMTDVPTSNHNRSKTCRSGGEETMARVIFVGK